MKQPEADEFKLDADEDEDENQDKAVPKPDVNETPQNLNGKGTTEGEYSADRDQEKSPDLNLDVQKS